MLHHGTMSDLTFWLEDIRIFSPDDAVFVDTQTMIALQIFQDPRASRSTRWRSVELPRFTIPIVFLCFLAFQGTTSLVHTTHVPKLDLGVFGYWIIWIAPLALCCYLIWSRSKPLRSKSKLCLVRRYGMVIWDHMSHIFKDGTPKPTKIFQSISQV